MFNAYLFGPHTLGKKRSLKEVVEDMIKGHIFSFYPSLIWYLQISNHPILSPGGFFSFLFLSFLFLFFSFLFSSFLFLYFPLFSFPFLFLSFLYRATIMAYGSFQARGWIGLGHTPQLTAMWYTTAHGNARLPDP